MVDILKMADRLFDGFDGHSSVSSKCVSEMAMALHYIRRDYPAGMVDAAALAQAEAPIFDWIHQDGWLRMIGNESVLHQCATPYVFLRPRFHSPLHEGLIADVAAHDRMLRECTPYRRTERNWFLAELGPGPDWDRAAIRKEARRAHGVDRMLAYAFTHGVIYVTLSAKDLRPDPQVKGVAMILLAQADARNDLDLFWEWAIWRRGGCCLRVKWRL
ncbi:MAG: hypothetical protein NTX73_10020 [Rhodobacterales bacterium]|nr:hypothetical protein [Rhodobacterales bacterium]